MKKLLPLLCAVLLCLLNTAPVVAQTTATIAELQIDFWPEFDQPGLLIIYRGTLASNVTVPVALAFDLPSDIKPLAVAYKDAQDQLLDLQYTFANGKLAFTAPTKYFQFEYYAPLNTSTPSRQFNFKTQIAYPIQKLALYAQQPPSAQNFATTPKGESKVEVNGLTYATVIKQNMPANETITLEITYTKATSILTAPRAEPLAIATTTPAATLPIDPTLLTVIIAAVVVVTVLGGGIWYIRQNNTNSYTAPTTRRPKEKGHPPKPKEVNPTKAAGSVGYCHECGEPTNDNDNFCRKCGTKIRR